MDVLSQQALNRATLERQMLLRRCHATPLEVVERLAGMQGQDANAPYIGMWTRLESFHQEELTRLLYERKVVRSSVLRGTQHLVTAEDFLWLRPLVQPVLERARQAAFGRATKGLDLQAFQEAARELLAGRTLTRPQLGKLLAERFPGYEPLVLGWSAQALLALVHEPPNGTWGKGGATPFTLAEEWIGRPLSSERPVRLMVRRYLAAFGPASVKDVQRWSGLSRLGAELEQLRPELRTFRDEAGNELFDLPGAPLPDADTPAPVRFLPAFDNLLVGHDDRTRLISDDHRRRVITGSEVRPTILVDGFVRGVWSLRENRPDKTVTLKIEQYERLADTDRDALAEEGARLLAFAVPDAEARLEFTGP